MKRIFASRRTRWAAIVILIVLPAMLAAYSVFEFRRPNSFGEDHGFLNFFANNSDWILGLLFLAISAVPFLLVFERRRPQARELVPIAVMSALAVVGRTVFSIVPLPNFKPCSAIIMITAIVFGPETGFLTGALTAFVSNFIFGQGPWTPWQMFSWGMIGLVTGLLYRIGVFGTVGQVQTDEHGKRKKPVRLCVFGFFCGIAYGWFMNLQYIIGYVDPINWKTIGLAYAQSLYFDISHGVCTALVLYLAAEPWTRKLMRIRRKFSLGER